jgi:hypothetical protein
VAEVKRTITATKNYRLFTFSSDNRQRNDRKHKKLLKSMQQYGFLASFPIVCARDGAGNLVVKDGQHRLMFAEELGLPVHYTVESVPFDIAVVNSTAKVWALIDYAEKFATNGVESYVAGLKFANRFKLPVGTAFSLLAGTTTFSNVHEDFIDGKFQIRDQLWAEDVAFLYTGLISISSEVDNKRCIEACMACCRVSDFDKQRLLGGAKRNREALKAYSTRDGFLEMLETIYNFGRKNLVPLKIQAIQAMRDRLPVRSKAVPE